MFRPSHSIHDECEGPQVGLAKRNLTLVGQGPSLARDERIALRQSGLPASPSVIRIWWVSRPIGVNTPRWFRLRARREDDWRLPTALAASTRACTSRARCDLPTRCPRYGRFHRSAGPPSRGARAGAGGGRTAIAGAGNERFERNRTSVRREGGSRTPSGSGNRAPGRQLRNDPSCRSTTLRNALNSASPGSPEP